MAGAWILTVPPGKVLSEAIKRKAGERVQGPVLNLLALDVPSLMSEWVITSLRVPAYLYVINTVAASSIVTLTLTLRIGGDIVWQESKELQQSAYGVGFLSNTTFSADFQNPLRLPHGRTMTLEATASANQESESLQIGVGEAIVGEASETHPKAQRAEGSLQYYVHELSGHRRL